MLESKTYVMFVHCRHMGVSRDAGEHTWGNYESDKEARRKLLSKTIGLKRYYDQVSCTIKQGERTVCEFSL